MIDKVPHVSYEEEFEFLQMAKAKINCEDIEKISPEKNSV